MGARIETTDGHAPMPDRRRPAGADRLRAAGRVRPGEVGDPPRRPLRGGRRDHGRRAGADARPHRAHARRGGRPRAVGERTVSVWPVDRLDARRVDVPGDFSSAAAFIVAATLVPGLGAAPPRDQPQPAPHRPPRRRSSGWVRASPSTTGASIGGEPGADLEVRLGRARGDERRRRRGAARDRRAAARSRWLASMRARRQRRCAAPTSCARRRPTGSRPSSTGCERSARTSAPRRTASVVRGVPTRLRGGRLSTPGRPPDRDARRDRRSRLPARACGSRMLPPWQ